MYRAPDPKGDETSLGKIEEHLQQAIDSNLQRDRVDEDDETDELASLSESAEALRLTAAAPPRPTPSGGDYE